MSSISAYKVLTVTHHKLDITDIGNFYVKIKPGDELTVRLKEIKAHFGFEEFLYMETCNRVCFIIYTTQEFNEEILKDFFFQVNPQLEAHTLRNLSSFLDFYQGESALKHVFEMASSMDSLVIGEREIFRQFRSAYEKCKSNELCGDNMRILETATVNTAKRIYSETKIAEKAISVVSLALQELLHNNSNRNQSVLLIGSGETNTLVGKFLKKYKFNNISIYNRSLDNAKHLAEQLEAHSYNLSELEFVSGSFDTIIICTAANRVVIDNDLYGKMLKGNTEEKLIIDLAVPRNVSEDVVKKNKVKYIDISDLKHLAEVNHAYRKNELDKAQPIIESQLKAFNKMYNHRQIEKAMSFLPREIKSIRKKAVEEVYASRLKSMDEEALELLHDMMDYMEKKCISVPLKAAKAQFSR